MKKFLIFLAFLCLVLMGICAWQMRELSRTKHEASRTRLALAEEQQSRAEQASASRYVERREREWQEKAMQLTAMVGTLRSSESAHASNYARLAQASAPANGTQTPEAAGSSGGTFGKGMGEMISKMMNDPNMREFMRSQQSAIVKKMYGPLIRDLKLPPEQQQKLTDLLLDQQMQTLDRSQALMKDGNMDFKKMAADGAEVQKESDAAIQELLGPEKFAEFGEYKKTMAERMQLSEFKEQMKETASPLLDEQTQQMLAVIKEERERHPPVYDASSVAQAQDLESMFADGMMERQMAWQEELNRNVLARLSSILTPEQLKAYTGIQEQQLSMQKFGLKMAREMFGKGASAPGPGAPPVRVPE